MVLANFSQSYAEARAKFLTAAETSGLDVDSRRHPLLGRDGEVLALDVVLDGARDAAAVLLFSSACHGVEGFCGSAVQTTLLGDAAFREQAREAGVALLYLHALNPYGFSWWRRTTHENVDLNRNFPDFTQALAPNRAYDELAGLLVPAHWPPSDAVAAELQALTDARGMPTIQSAITRGQHSHPQGLFFSGVNPSWSHLTLRQALRDHAQRCRRLGWIDVHTGLGPNGIGERIFAGADDAVAVARARRWWGEKVTSMYDGSSSSSKLNGLMWNAATQECPQAEYTGIALEFGTVPIEQMIDALRADQWLENHPEADDAQRQAIKRQTRDAFYTDTDGWKAQVLAQAGEVARQAVAGLAGG